MTRASKVTRPLTRVLLTLMGGFGMVPIACLVGLSGVWVALAAMTSGGYVAWSVGLCQAFE
jgi:hypothetical protein